MTFFFPFLPFLSNTEKMCFNCSHVQEPSRWCGTYWFIQHSVSEVPGIFLSEYTHSHIQGCCAQTLLTGLHRHFHIFSQHICQYVSRFKNTLSTEASLHVLNKTMLDSLKCPCVNTTHKGAFYLYTVSTNFTEL